MGYVHKESSETNYQHGIVCVTDLGEIRRIPALEFYNETEPKSTVSEETADENTYWSKSELNYTSHSFVVFIPHNGVRIDQITRFEKQYNQRIHYHDGEIDENFSYATGDENGFDDGEDGEGDLSYLPDFSYVRYDRDYTSTDKLSLLPKGSYFLGEEQSYVDRHTYINTCSGTGNSDTIEDHIRHKSWTKYIISGVANESRLTVFGSQSCAEKIKMYKVQEQQGHYTLMFDGSVDSSHTVSNLVFFDAPTFQSSSWFSIAHSSNQLEKRVQSHSEEPPSFTMWEDQLTYGDMSLDKINWKYDYAASDLISNDIKGAYLYIDCFFTIYSPYSSITKLSEQERIDSCNGYSRTIPMIYPLKDGSGNITYRLSTTTAKVAKTKLISDLPGNRPVDSLGPEHQWYKMVKHGFSGLTITIDDAMNVRLIGKDNGKRMFDDIDADSDYCRSTDYWIDFGVKKLVKYDSTFADSPDIHNKLFIKLFKPYACAIFDLGCLDGRGTFPPSSSTILKKMVKENIRQDTILADEYIKVISVNGFDGEAKNINIDEIKAYAKTLAPFRLELYRSHGGRYEYDKDNTQGNMNGKYEIQFAGDFCLTSINLKWLHDVIFKWSYYIPQAPVNIVMYSESCFGGGLKYGINRNIYGSYNEIQQTNQVINAGRAACFLSAGPLHTSTTWGFSLLSEIMESIWKADKSVTYQKMAQNINNLYRNARKKMFALIKRFYIQNYDLMLRCLANPDHVQMWNETKEKILADLDNSGMTYFGSYDWKKNERNYNCSDNYFFPDQRKYPIHDGFVGFIKQEVISDYSEYNKITGRKFFKETGTFDDEILDIETRSLCGDIFKMAKEALGLTIDDMSQIHSHVPDDLWNELLAKGTLHKYKEIMLFIRGLICGTYAFVDPAIANSTVPFGSNPEKYIQDWLTSDSELKNLYDNKTEIRS